MNDFLINIKNPILRSDFSADYEVHAQYVFLDEIEISQNKKKELEENYKSLFLSFLKHNYTDYIHLSIINYIGQWSTGMRLIDNIKDYPLKSGIEQISGYIAINSKIILILSQIFLLFCLYR